MVSLMNQTNELMNVCGFINEKQIETELCSVESFINGLFSLMKQEWTNECKLMNVH